VSSVLDFAPEGAPPPPIRDAATVLALRDTPDGIEVFMVRRASRMGFLGGAHVFPGGALDAKDAEPRLLDLASGFEAVGDLGRIHEDSVRARGLLLAAARELFEESGILLARSADGDWVDLDEEGPRSERLAAGRAALSARGGDFAALMAGDGLRVDVSGLRFFAHWITPEREKRRFDTRFFLARAPERQSARHCDVESSEGEWITPARAFERYRGREIELVPPTIASLERLCDFASVDDALAAFELATVPCILPKILIGDEVVILYPGDCDYASGTPEPAAGRPTNRLVMKDGLWHRP
jgi:8-oxo-dGTP pyrophosphatase MutT (NUDIX family)